MESQSTDNITKEELTKIIDDLHFHIMIILLCMDELDALCEIKREEKIKLQANNFFYIAHSSLIFRYEIELAKLVNNDEQRSVIKICALCKTHADYFFAPEEINNLCNRMKQVINSYSEQNYNLKQRRNTALAHSDSDYYFYDEKYIKDYPIDYDKLKQEAEHIYNFAKELQFKIGSARTIVNFPAQSDDVKHLFGIKTDADIEKERIENKLKENWKQSKQ